MKKLFSSTISLLTSSAIILAGSALPAFADQVPIDDGITEELCSEEVYIGDIYDLEIPYPDMPDINSNFSDISYNYKDFLDDNNTLVYNALEPLVDTPSSEPVTIKLKDPVTITLSTLPTSPNISDEELESYQLSLFGCCKPGLDAFTFDHPEFCWLDVTKIAVRPGDDTYISRSIRKGTYTIRMYSVTITPDCYSGFEKFSDIPSYLDKMWDVVEDFPVTGETRYEQIKSIHDHLCLNTYYDIQAKFRGSALGALVEPGVVCEGYAKAFKIICDKINIPCVVVFGNYDETEDAAHMWNYVQMEDGIWYAIDVTWDDLDGEDGREIKYQYFIKGSRSFNLNHTAEPDYNITYLNYPEISVRDYVPSSTHATTTTTTTTTTKATTTTTKATTTTTKPTTKATTTTTKATTATTKATTTTTKATTTTTKATTTTTKATTTTTKTTTTTTKATNTTTKATTTTTKATTTTTAPPEALEGDLNCDGEVNVADLVYCADTVLGRIKPKNSCDINKDKNTDIFDVIYMRKLIIKLLK